MDRFSHRNNLTPFDTNWREGSGATPLATQDLFFGDAISIPTAPTKTLSIAKILSTYDFNRIRDCHSQAKRDSTRA